MLMEKRVNSRLGLVPLDFNLSRPKRSNSPSGLGILHSNLSRPKRSQLTLFVIIGLVIVTGVVLFFVLRDGGTVSLSKEMKPVYDYYVSCLEETSRQGIALLGEQGGFIYSEELGFVPGSSYMPFSSHLDFFGQPIPYWMYVSGNNLLKEQMPSRNFMEGELERYVSERVSYCDFSDFEKQGYDVFVDFQDVDVSANINELDVEVFVKNQIRIYFENQSVFVNNHNLGLNSKLGKFYDLAKDVYDFEKQNMFLENYALDVLRLYAPVTGVEISCEPKIFDENEIREELVNALSSNVGALKLEGDYYTLNTKEGDYFVSNIGRSVDEQVNFVYSPSWFTKVEMQGDLIARPVGLQEGLGILGFCYVPYHFVYDVAFPVLIQFYDSEEIFQFPVVVLINKNQAREALPSVYGESIESEVCNYKNKNLEVYTYDTELNPVEARIRFKCLSSECSVGETKVQGNDAVLNANFPRCVNGFVLASAEGYANSKVIVSTNEQSSVDIILNRLYGVDILLNTNKKALISFVSSEHSATIMYPETKEVQLSEGYYNVSVYVYSESSLVFPAISTKECFDVPEQGILGLVGIEEEKCYDINLPAHEVDVAIVGGGNAQEYFAESQLKSKRLNIGVDLFDTPSSLEELQEGYAEIENSILRLDFG